MKTGTILRNEGMQLPNDEAMKIVKVERDINT